MQPAARMLCSWASRQPSAQAKLLLQPLGQQALVGVQGCGSCLIREGIQQLRYASADSQSVPSEAFLQQKVSAMELPNPTDVGLHQQINATTVRPNKSNASKEQVAQVVGHSALIVSRPVEWGKVIFGYERAHHYTIYNQDSQVVAQLAEDHVGVSNQIKRQIIRSRRFFTATVFSADGSQVIFKLRRPLHFINSTMYIQDAEGNILGEVKQRWDLIKRKYDLYLGKSQFAALSGGFFGWEFELKDANGGTLAQIDRYLEVCEDEYSNAAPRRYVVNYGRAPEEAAAVANQTITATTGTTAHSSVSSMALARIEVADIPKLTGPKLAVVRALKLDERMIALAAAISIDYDFFSQRSHRHDSGGHLDTVHMPGPGGGGEDGAPAHGSDAGPTQGPSDDEMHLDGDDFTPPSPPEQSWSDWFLEGDDGGDGGGGDWGGGGGDGGGGDGGGGGD